MAPAVKADDNPIGTKGGAMIFHRPWLQSATPAPADGTQDRILFENDLAWKHFRIKGLHIIIGTIYFDHTIGFTGPNLQKFNMAVYLTDNGKRMLILCLFTFFFLFVSRHRSQLSFWCSGVL